MLVIIKSLFNNFFCVKIRFMELLSQSGQNFQEGDFKIGVSCKETEKLLFYKEHIKIPQTDTYNLWAYTSL